MFSKPVPDFAKGQCDHCASPTGAAPTELPCFARHEHDLSGDPDSVRHDVSGISDAYKTSLGPAPKPKRKRHDTLSSAALALYDRGIKPFDVGLILAGMSGIDEFQPYFEPGTTGLVHRQSRIRWVSVRALISHRLVVAGCRRPALEYSSSSLESAAS